jgi:superfamily II DNA or RNA helicase
MLCCHDRNTQNRLNDKKFLIDNVGLVIIDEAHYNSFRKLFSSFKKSYIIGVTATPLSSNIKLPMYQNYNELIVGDTIQSLIDKVIAKQQHTAMM